MSLLSRLGALAVVASCCAPLAVRADNECQVTFVQDGAKLQPVMMGRWSLIHLDKAPFEVNVAPAECRPLIATLTTQALVNEVASWPDRVFSPDGFGYASAPEDDDLLNWPSRPAIRTSLREITSDWNTIDVYKAESARLGYELPVVNAFGSAMVFKEADASMTASFRRLTKAIPLSPSMPKLQLPAVIYLNEKDLLKPSWSGALALHHLRRPYRVLFSFESKHLAQRYAEMDEAQKLNLGERVYAVNCQACHQSQGQGAGPIPSLVNAPKFAQNASAIDVVVNGVKNSGMPGWGKLLGNEEVAAVINYVRNRFGSESVEIVHPEDVKSVRK